MEYLLIALSIVIGALVVHYLFRNFNFFKRHDVVYVPSVPILGVMAPVIFRRTSFVDFIRKLYNFNRDAKYIGLHAMTRPVLLLRDPELIKFVLVKNFDTFHDRPAQPDNEHVLAQSLFFVQKKKWRDIRHLLSPFFTSSKMKILFTLMSEYAAKFTSIILSGDVNMKDIFERYTNDIIAQCCFGIEIDSIRDPTNEFYACGKEITHMSVIRSIKFIFIRTFPRLARIFNIKLLNNRAMRYFETSIKNRIVNSERIMHLDLIQLMMNNRGKKNRVQLDVDDMVAQAYVFYFGGFETSSGVMSFIAHKIVVNPNVQMKLRQEIDKALDESNGSVTYDTINRLEYLHAVIKEALRLFAPSVLERVCDRAFELPPALPGRKPFTVEKNMIVWIPAYAIHCDEKYYDDPEEFRPERFLDSDTHDNLYFPFGLGPKMCIGNRFGMLMIKIVLFHLLARCELKHCSKTKPLRFSKKNLIMMAEDGFWLNVQRREDIHTS